MPGHKHDSSAGTQNQGNTLGDRACVRQSKLYRMHESGNDIKSILGTPHLCWDTHKKQGAYEGHDVYDHTRDNPFGMDSKYQQNRRHSQGPQGTGGAPFARGDSYGATADYTTTSGGYGDKKSTYTNDSYGGYDSTGAQNYGKGRAPPAADYDYDSGYGGNSGYGSYGGNAPSVPPTKYSSNPNQDRNTAYRTGLGGNDEYGTAAAPRNSLGSYSQATRRHKQLEELPPNPYARGGNDENVRDANSYQLSQMRDMKQQMDNSSFRRGGAASGNSMSLSNYAGGRASGNGAREDRSTRPW